MNRKIYAAIVAAVLVAIGVSLVLADDDKTPAIVTAPADSNGNGRPDTTVTAPEALVDQVEKSDVGDHDGLRNQAPPGAPEQSLVNAAKQRDHIKRSQPPLPTAGASENARGCTTRFIGSQSSRGAVRPNSQWAHYTVSLNRPGWSDVWAIVTYFSGVQASSNFVIDADGNCAYIVPIENKAWTQAAFNPVAVSYEVIGMGNEAVYLNPAGYRKIATVMRWVSQKTGIPMRLGAISNGTVTRSGIVDHAMGGAPAGGHHDIRPHDIRVVVNTILATGTVSSSLTKTETAVAYKRCYHRRQHLAGVNRPENLKWARFYRDRILLPANRGALVGGHVQLIPAIDAAKRADGKPWSHRHRGNRRAQLATTRTGKAC